MNAARRFPLHRALAVAGAVLLFGTGLCAAPAARAQDPEPVEMKPLAIKLGVFFPTQGTLRNQAGSPYYHIGTEYNPNFRYKPAGGNVVFNLDFLFRDSGNLSFLTIPIIAKVLWNLTPVDYKYRAYAGLGPGVYFINTGFIGATTQAGVRFTAGIDLSSRYFTEVNYDYVGGFTDYLGNGVRTDGLSFLVGARF